MSCPRSPTSPPRTRPGAPQVWAGIENNIGFDWEAGDKAKAEELIAKAAHVTRLTVVNNRVVVASMEARAAVAEYDEAEGKFTLHCGTQGSWLVKDLLGGQRLQAAAGEVPRRHAGCRRRLRHEALPLRRVRAGLHGRAARSSAR